MPWTIEFPYEDVEQFVMDLPPGLRARYVILSDTLLEFGSDLGMPHTRAMSNGLFELRVKGKEGIARVFYCTLINQRIVMLHGFVKKSQKNPNKELRIAKKRLSEIKEHGI